MQWSSALFRLASCCSVLLSFHVLCRRPLRFVLRLKIRKVIRSLEPIGSFVRWLVWGVGILATLHVLGLDLTPVFTTGGLFAVALGFALKDIVGNYFAGLVIKANDFVKHGDVLDIEGQMVRVKNIGVRDTLVRTKDGLDILIPNSALVQNNIGNYTLHDSLCRVWTTVGVSYSSDLKQVRQVLEETLKRH